MEKKISEGKKKKTVKKCTHNGGKAFWSNLPGFKCLKCGAEVNEK